MMIKNGFIALTACMVLTAAVWAEPDVYVSGYEYSDSTTKLFCYWKNGERVTLTTLTGFKRYIGIIGAITLSGNDVYVIGHVEGVLYYWKNGEKTVISNSNPNTSFDIAVSGNDVYVAGTDRIPDGFSGAGYWKNGKKVTLTTSEGDYKFLVFAYGIAVSGEDVYVLGTEINRDDSVIRCYWKNGKKVTVEVDSFSKSKTGFSKIAVSGEDVYLAGSSKDSNGNWIACYWKNDKKIILPGGSSTSDIFISGEDVYVAGSDTKNDKSEPCYWKNGKKVLLPLGDNAKDSSGQATGIAVSGNNVYVVGSKRPLGDSGNNSELCYWVNGEKKLLAGRNIKGSATGIALGGAR